jgi:hypothetical protein
LGEGGAIVGAKKETVGKVAKASELVDCEREELDVAGIERRNDGDVGSIITIADELRLCFLVVPVVSGSRIWKDTGRSRGRPGDNNINGEVGGGTCDGTPKVSGE